MMRIRKRDITTVEEPEVKAPAKVDPQAVEYTDAVARALVEAMNAQGAELHRKIALKGKRPDYVVSDITYDHHDRLTGFVLKPRGS